MFYSQEMQNGLVAFASRPAGRAWMLMGAVMIYSNFFIEILPSFFALRIIYWGIVSERLLGAKQSAYYLSGAHKHFGNLTSSVVNKLTST